MKLKRQNARLLALTVSFLLFPVIIFYFSPYLIVLGAFQGVLPPRESCSHANPRGPLPETRPVRLGLPGRRASGPRGEIDRQAVHEATAQPGEMGHMDAVGHLDHGRLRRGGRHPRGGLLLPHRPRHIGVEPRKPGDILRHRRSFLRPEHLLGKAFHVPQHLLDGALHDHRLQGRQGPSPAPTARLVRSGCLHSLREVRRGVPDEPPGGEPASGRGDRRRRVHPMRRLLRRMPQRRAQAARLAAWGRSEEWSGASHLISWRGCHRPYRV